MLITDEQVVNWFIWYYQTINWFMQNSSFDNFNPSDFLEPLYQFF
jgi:hypothetical protein